MHIAYIFMFIAIVAETIGTTALQASQQFTRTVPSIIVVVSYAVSFYLLSFVLRHIPVGITYAIWSGLGIVSIAAIGYLAFGQKLDIPALIGMGFILTGILIVHLFSNSAPH